MNVPFLPRTASAGVKTAVVSGLGPNGVLAALELMQAGYHVTVVEKRPAYTRPIHLHLRQSYLDDVRRLSPKLHAKLMALATPIQHMERTRRPGSVSVMSQNWPAGHESLSSEDRAVRERLMTAPVAHVRLDSAERLFYTYLSGLTGLQYGLDAAHRLTIRRGFHLELEPDALGRFHASIRPADLADPHAPQAESLGIPDLVVLAEGGKSASVQKLGLQNVRFSYAKFFMSAHVPVSFGPKTRRVDTNVRHVVKGEEAAEVSFWACGHGDPKQGTWIVLEVPESMMRGTPEQAIEFFVAGANMLFGTTAHAETIRRSVADRNLLGSARRCTSPDGAAHGTPFAGTFKFEQQCLRNPGLGANLVVIGDSAGMGHHALSSGLEMGACDLQPLRKLAQAIARGEDANEAVRAYGERVFRSRMTLLALGMREYYPALDFDPVDLLHRAAELAETGGAGNAREAFEALLADAIDEAPSAARSLAA